jgi:hypothetical protein
MFSTGTALSSLSARRQAVLRGPAPAADPLAGIHPGIQSVLWSWLMRAIDESLWEMAGLFPPSSPALEPFEQHGPPPFPDGYLRPRPLDGLRRLMRGEARLSIEALEILVLSRVPQPRVEQALLAHCTRICQLYLEMQRRLGPGFASSLLIGELRLLRHRGSTVAAPLAFG